MLINQSLFKNKRVVKKMVQLGLDPCRWRWFIKDQVKLFFSYKWMLLFRPPKIWYWFCLSWPKAINASLNFIGLSWLRFACMILIKMTSPFVLLANGTSEASFSRLKFLFSYKTCTIKIGWIVLDSPRLKF